MNKDLRDGQGRGRPSGGKEEPCEGMGFSTAGCTGTCTCHFLDSRYPDADKGLVCQAQTRKKQASQ